MLRFLTNELQDAEDAGDRGEHLSFPSSRNTAFIYENRSMDSRPCSQWLRWVKCPREPYQSMYVTLRAQSSVADTDALSQFTKCEFPLLTGQKPYLTPL